MTDPKERTASQAWPAPVTHSMVRTDWIPASFKPPVESQYVVAFNPDCGMLDNPASERLEIYGVWHPVNVLRWSEGRQTWVMDDEGHVVQCPEARVVYWALCPFRKISGDYGTT